MGAPEFSDDSSTFLWLCMELPVIIRDISELKCENRFIRGCGVLHVTVLVDV